MSPVRSLTLAARLLLNVHDLNNEGATGNVLDIRKVDMVGPDGKRFEAPAISGRMVKHWHAEALRELAQDQGLPLCDACRLGEPLRPGRLVDGALQQVSNATEKDAVAQCVICDIHGYLIAQEGRGAGGAADVTRRTSRAQFSWVLPVLDSAPAVFQVNHTRVSQSGRMAGGESAQMLYSKSYAAMLAGLVAALDVGAIGRTLNGQQAAVDTAARARAAWAAFRYVLSGRLGASLSHALPHVDIVEVVACAGLDRPLPFPPSPIYRDYLDKLAGILPAGDSVRVLVYTTHKEAQVPARATRCLTLDDLFAAVDQMLAG